MLVVAATFVAACGDDSSSSTYGGAPATSAAAVGGAPYGAPATGSAAVSTTSAAADASAGDARTLRLASTSLGSVLVDGSGRTLYIFTKDDKDKSNCTGGCLTTWPPLYGTPVAGDGVTAAKLGTITTADGRTQATIDGRPLYHYQPDAAPGDVKGQNVGGSWFVVDGTGTIER